MTSSATNPLDPQFSEKEELEALSQAIAMSDGPYFATIVANDGDQIEKALAEIKDSVARFSKKTIPFRMFHAEDVPDQNPIKILEDLLCFATPWQYVLVIDCSRANRRNQAAWFSLFKKMNETRNKIFHKHPGSLILILPLALEQGFFARAPDLWSICGFFIRLHTTKPKLSLPNQSFLKGPIILTERCLLDYRIQIEDLVRRKAATKGLFENDADEILQDVFLKLTRIATTVPFGEERRPLRFETRKQFFAYLRNLTRNTIDDYLKGIISYRQLFSLDEVEVASIDISPEQQAYYTELKDHLIQILKTLPPEDKKILYMVFSSEMTTTQAAKILHRSLAQVRYKVRKLKNMLYSRLMIKPNDSIPLREALEES